MKYAGPEVRQPGCYDLKQASDQDAIKDFGPSLTQQNQSEEADINNIVRKFGLTGQLPENVHMPVYADFDDVYDYHTARTAIASANSSFMKMPADVRARFDNDPALFVDYCSNPENLPELRKLGLAHPGQDPKRETQNTPPEGGTGTATT